MGEKKPYPAAAMKSNYFAMVDAELCIGCGTCTTAAMRLVKKEDHELYHPPESVAAMLTALFAQWGKSLFFSIRQLQNETA